MVVSPGGWTGRAECLSSELNITGAHSLSATLWVWGGLSFSLCPLSFSSLSLLSLSNKHWLWALRDRIFFSSHQKYTDLRSHEHSLYRRTSIWIITKNPLKFLLCVTSAESSTEKWRAQFVAYFNRQREHLKADETDLASCFLLSWWIGLSGWTCSGAAGHLASARGDSRTSGWTQTISRRPNAPGWAPRRGTRRDSSAPLPDPRSAPA